MRYGLEILRGERLGTGRGFEDTIEADAPIPIPHLGDDVPAPGGWTVRVVERQFWYTYVNKTPLVKVQVRCQRDGETEPCISK